MVPKKHLWHRLASLEEEYRALTSAEVEDLAPPPGRPLPTATVRCIPGPRLDQMEKEICALRLRFGMQNDLASALDPPTRPRVVMRALPPGRMHPVTPQEILEVLGELPPQDLDGLTTITLCDARRDRHASYGGQHVKLFYPVGHDLRVRLRRYEGWWEVCRFGAWVEEDEEGVRYVCWERGDLKNYVLRHLLLHEIGHHVAYLRGMAYAVAATRREEEFAESYAHARFDPDRL